MTHFQAIILSNIHNSSIAFNGDVVHQSGAAMEGLLALLHAYISHSQEICNLVTSDWVDEESQVRELERVLEEGKRLEGIAGKLGVGGGASDFNH
ncbi:hypothetical protein [Anditalea andensis]|uniref:Uncharacterized protein n=1 Tax=Anditalea andensis TaxID=1048983 RepID=A0A074KVI3_9BACT|nr:hypothetical protein [Anditalea andensis]KEO72954.1 hypothetical protein EL17_15155 [Anditalea andensis]